MGPGSKDPCLYNYERHPAIMGTHMLKKAEYTPSPSNKKDQAPSETLGLFLIPGALSGSLCGAPCGSLLLPLALALSAEGLMSYS